MKKHFSIALTFLIFLLPGFLGSQETEEQPEAAAACCFQHDGYQGNCVVTPTDEESCESILEYLNTPGKVGKAYCNGSKLRGGWKQVACE
ncbi:hypothetical protein L0222_32245 [bacterium]|nr:hypothetical protein [bacterium]